MNHTKFLVLAILLAASCTMVNAQKIGYLNSTALLQEIPDVKQANASLETLQKQLQKRYEDMVQGFQAKYAGLNEQKQRGELSPKQEQEEGAKLQQEQNKITQEEAAMQTQLDDKRRELLQPLLDRVSAIVAEVAQENGYTHVIDDSAGLLVYKDENSDITPLVKKKLGLWSMP